MNGKLLCSINSIIDADAFMVLGARVRQRKEGKRASSFSPSKVMRLVEWDGQGES